MQWRKILTTILIVATVTLFVITVRQHDTNSDLKKDLGIQYAQKVQSFRVYVQDLQSANDTGDSISINNYYAESNSFPIKTRGLTDHMNRIYDEMDKISDGKAVTSTDRRQLSEDLNTLQLTLTDIIRFSNDDPITWYSMVNDENSKIQKVINKYYK